MTRSKKESRQHPMMCSTSVFYVRPSSLFNLPDFTRDFRVGPGAAEVFEAGSFHVRLESSLLFSVSSA